MTDYSQVLTIAALEYDSFWFMAPDDIPTINVDPSSQRYKSVCCQTHKNPFGKIIHASGRDVFYLIDTITYTDTPTLLIAPSNKAYAITKYTLEIKLNTGDGHHPFGKSPFIDFGYFIKDTAFDFPVFIENTIIASLLDTNGRNPIRKHRVIHDVNGKILFEEECSRNANEGNWDNTDYGKKTFDEVLIDEYFTGIKIDDDLKVEQSNVVDNSQKRQRAH